ncbi:MarR family transcriptional regulator [Plantibacter sp. PA-3-X8]|uniref:Transcriptional regulator, MarR family n=1 Tax=Plantibacter elymi (nom. nud.) TaxID=199708 RepID=A0ABY1R8G3_9MICO|nr:MULTISPECIES: MarR family transcriptional regulator [Plantibacter]AZH82408.1 MarR family transcriptional regulator [Plantibacter sp. PA-3-X8]MBD8465147.1 winged helix DNA-binding protein [Plantibacter sp. CFBP 8798]MBD8536589.1 winged helix DNA-binding protein [Plantibacter sp. CFBP 13570]MDD9151441.1 winged helix DNA-binding protein [Plantibacter flavus]CAH0180495.1 Multidrug resistance operon repressor [Plantibacter cousiniae]
MSDDVDPAEAGAVIQASLATVLRWSTRADNRRSLHDAEGAALTATDAWLLEYVITAGPIRMSTVAGWMDVDKSTATAEVRRLEEGGLVVRATDPSDRRAVLVSATEEGRTALERHRQAAQQVYNTLVGKWSERDRAELARLLSRFVDEFSWVSDAVSQHNASR